MSHQQYRLITREEMESKQDFSFRTWRVIEKMAEINGYVWDKQVPQEEVAPRGRTCNNTFARKLRRMIKDPMACVYRILLVSHDLSRQAYYCWDHNREHAAIFCPPPLSWSKS